jgi:DNA-binding HxlR family transcriptional regulator
MVGSTSLLLFLRFPSALFSSSLENSMRNNTTDYSCTAAFAIELIQGKWRVEILCAMKRGPVRLGQLTRLIPRASKKVLTENLRKMEASGLIVRTEVAGSIPHVEYALVETIKDETHRLLDELTKWSELFRGVPS